MDLNGDGHDDMISGSYWPGHVTIFEGRGEMKFAKGYDLQNSDGTKLHAGPKWKAKDKFEMDSLAAAPHAMDWDGDGAPELVCTGFWNHPEDSQGQERLTTAIMLLDIGPRGELSGQFNAGDPSRQTVGSLRAYGHFPPTPSAGLDYVDSQWMLSGAPILSAPTGSNKIEFTLKTRLILMLDSQLRPIGDGLRPGATWDIGKPLPNVEDVWQPRWPPDDEKIEDP